MVTIRHNSGRKKEIKLIPLRAVLTFKRKSVGQKDLFRITMPN